jgi:hypothetical protein
MNQKQLSFFLMLAMLPSMLPIGYSIREYYDTKDYTRLAISLVVVIVIIYMARFFSKIAFKKEVTQ